MSLLLVDEEIELLCLCNNNIIETVKNTQINSVMTKALFSENDFFMFSTYITSFKLIYSIKYYEKTFSIIYIIMKNKIYLNNFKFHVENKEYVSFIIINMK